MHRVEPHCVGMCFTACNGVWRTFWGGNLQLQAIAALMELVSTDPDFGNGPAQLVSI